MTPQIFQNQTEAAKKMLCIIEEQKYAAASGKNVVQPPLAKKDRQ